MIRADTECPDSADVLLRQEPAEEEEEDEGDGKKKKMTMMTTQTAAPRSERALIYFSGE
jgi:hypothetical protein